jgi:KUP system potassium uptake protein
VIAILASVVASQSMITATFSLVQQLINTQCFPPIGMRHTSDTFQGQIYLPTANWLLMIGTIAIVGAFKDLSKLSNAFGFAVATVMFSTTVLLAIHMYYRKMWPLLVAIAFFLIFGFFDGLLWGSALKKVPLGAWVPLMIGIVL